MKISDEHHQLLTIRDWIRFGASLFNQHKLHFGHGTDNAWDEAVSLVLHAVHFPPDSHTAVLDARLTTEEKKTILALFQTRVQTRLPAPYITHEAFFAGMKFYVDKEVLIPRSSLGEFMEKQLDNWVSPDEIRHVLDLCTGSGCIAVAAAKAFCQAKIDAIDLSEAALRVAQRNISDYGLNQRIRTIHSDLFSGLRGERYDVILSNPPYVSADEMASLPEEYRHEPVMGLLAEDNGLAIVIKILQQAANFLTPQGLLIVEVGNSEEALAARFPQLPFIWLEFEQSEGGVFLLTREQLQEITL
jgi:ribosomal protein L3 glutamine methyltransferase